MLSLYIWCFVLFLEKKNKHKRVKIEFTEKKMCWVTSLQPCRYDCGFLSYLIGYGSLERGTLSSLPCTLPMIFSMSLFNGMSDRLKMMRQHFLAPLTVQHCGCVHGQVPPLMQYVQVCACASWKIVMAITRKSPKMTTRTMLKILYASESSDWVRKKLNGTCIKLTRVFIGSSLPFASY